jgi:hypothetical protein
MNNIMENKYINFNKKLRKQIIEQSKNSQWGTNNFYNKIEN